VNRCGLSILIFFVIAAHFIQGNTLRAAENPDLSSEIPNFRMTIRGEGAGQRVTLRADQADLYEVLIALEEKSGIPIGIDEDLEDMLTCDYRNLSLEKCLKKIIPNYSFLYKKSRNGCSLIGVSAFTGHGAGIFRKKIATLSYGNQSGRIGLIDIPEQERQGPQSFAVDENGNIYICDSVNGRIQIVSSDGENARGIPIEGKPADIVLDKEGNIIVLDCSKHKLCHYNQQGELLGEIPVKKSHLEAKDMMRFQDGNVYIRNWDQTEQVIARIEGGELIERSSEDEPQDGMGGRKQLYYQVRKLSGKTAEYNVKGGDGTLLNSIELYLPGLASIDFLGEDSGGNIYLQVEQCRPSGPGVNLGVIKLDEAGNRIASIDNIPNGYASWTTKLLTIGDTGDIFQMLPARGAVELNRWKWN